MPDFHRTTINTETFIRGAARLMWAGVTVAFPSNIAEVINMTTFNAMAGWNDLGATKNGVTISRNNAEESFDVDQILTDIEVLPTNWECSVSTSLAEMSLERLQVAWEGGPISVNAAVTPNEKRMGVGQPTSYLERRLAVLHQRKDGKIRAYLFHKVVRSAQESTATHAKTGDQQTAAARFRALADASIADVNERFFVMYDQV